MTGLPVARRRQALDISVRGVALWPGLVALAWVLQFAIDNDADPVSLVRSLLVAAGASLVVGIAVRLVIAHTAVAGAISAVIVMGLLEAGTPLAVTAFLAAVAGLLLEYRAERQGRLALPWPRIHEFLSIAALFLLVFQVTTYWATLRSRPAPTFDPSWSATAAVPGDRPNLYIVIADGHGRSDVLREALGYDDTPFIADLERLGFDVADSSHANYLSTHLSLPSFLSGAHLANLGVDMRRTPDNRLLSAATRDNPAMQLLRRLGYRVIVLPSGFDHLGERSGDDDLDTGQLAELEYRLLGSSAIGSWLASSLDAAWLAAGPARTFASLERLESIAKSSSPSPRVVFVHLALPHPPYGVDAQCNAVPFGPGLVPHVARIGKASPDAVKLAADQVRCTDRRLVATLRAVVAADPAATVILTSDHGPDDRLDWNAPAQPGLGDRAANLFAARTPGFDRLFPDDISLVNVMPRLFNTYFGTKLPLRPDDVYTASGQSDGTLHRVMAGSLGDLPGSMEREAMP